MMPNQSESAVASAFDNLDEVLKLEPSERKGAEDRHNQVRDCLSDAGLTNGGFLQGSFARSTMLKPLKDVDTVNLVAPAWRGVAEAPGGVQKMFDQFQSAVQAEWPTAEFDVDKKAGKALAATFSDCNFTVDICAALPTGDDDIVLLGDRDSDEQWQGSLTRKLNRIIAQRNQETDGVFVHQVRVLKTLKHLHDDLEDVDGIVIESLAYWSITSKMPFADAVAHVLRRSPQLLQGPMNDPANEGDLTGSWSEQKRGNIVRAFDRLAEQAEAALSAARNGDLEAALASWRAVVGSDFGGKLATPESALRTWNTSGRETSRWGVQHGDRRLAATPGRSWQAQ
jgi:hypothetical protein